MPGPLLVVTIDRLPAWIVPAYGATWVAMPGLDALAARGIVCDRLIVPTDDPTTNAMALVREAAAGRRPVLVTDDTGLATAASGCATRLVELPAARGGSARDASATCLAALLAAAREAVEAGGEGLVWCHAGSLAHTWDAPESFRAAYVAPEDPPPPTGAQVADFEVTADTDPDLVVAARQVFAGQLTMLDRLLAPLLEAVAGWSVVVAGVRGMPLGLHGHVGPSVAPPSCEVVHVPAIMVDRDGRMAAQRYGGLLMPCDLGATLGQPPDGPPPGGVAAWGPRSFAGPTSGRTFPPRDRVIAVTSGGVAIATPGWHFIAAADAAACGRLYVKPDDYFEIADVADRCPEAAERLARVAAAAKAGDLAAAWAADLPGPAAGLAAC